LVRIKDLTERLSNGGIFSLHGSPVGRPCFQGFWGRSCASNAAQTEAL
jgi:hypothetical protein